MKAKKGFEKTYRFEKGSSDKILVFVDAQGNERNWQVQCISSRIMWLLKVGESFALKNYLYWLKSYKRESSRS